MCSSLLSKIWKGEIKMKHCKNCDKCRLDLVSQYVLNLELYSCDNDHHRINAPFWEGMKCEHYKKDRFSHCGLLEMLAH